MRPTCSRTHNRVTSSPVSAAYDGEVPDAELPPNCGEQRRGSNSEASSFVQAADESPAYGSCERLEPRSHPS